MRFRHESLPQNGFPPVKRIGRFKGAGEDTIIKIQRDHITNIKKVKEKTTFAPFHF